MGKEIELLKNFNWKKFIFSIFIISMLYAVIKTFNYNLIKLIDDKEVHWIHGFIFSISASIVWLILIPFIFTSTVKIYFKNKRWFQLCLDHLLRVIIYAPIHAFIFLNINYFLQSYYDLWLPSEKKPYLNYFYRAFPNMTADSALFYCIIVGLLTGYLLYLKNIYDAEERAKVEASLVASNIQNLKYQLQPHFLFNSLQTISNLVHIDKKLADEAISNLSDILRFSINQLNISETSVFEELEITKKYLEFQKLRFGNHVDYEIYLDKRVSNYKIPSLLFQPLVENSIKHGYEKSGKAILIKLNMRIEEQNLILEVEDNGPGFTSEDMDKEGSTGLSNLQTRLNYFYKESSLLLIDNPGQGGIVRIIIPLYYVQV